MFAASRQAYSYAYSYWGWCVCVRVRVFEQASPKPSDGPDGQLGRCPRAEDGVLHSGSASAVRPASPMLFSRRSSTRNQCESGSGVLPVARSAVPAGTQARLLLTYVRLVEGGRMQRDRRVRVQRDAKGAPGAAQKDHRRRVERARAQSDAEGLLLPAEHGSRPVSAQGLRRRGRAIAQAERGSVQGGGAAGEDGESRSGTARAAACAPAVAGTAAAGAIDGDVQDGHHGFSDHAAQGACSGQGGNGSVSSRARTGQGARRLQGATRQGGIAAQGRGQVAATVGRRAVHGTKEQKAMDGDAPAEVEGCGELAEDGEQAGAQQHGGVAKPPLHGAASSMPARGSARMVVDGEGGGGVRGKRASSSERARTEAERGHGDNSIPIVTICTSTKDGEGRSATTRRVTRATAAMASTDDRAARGGQGGRGRGRERGRGRGGRVVRGASTGRSAGRDG